MDADSGVLAADSLPENQEAIHLLEDSTITRTAFVDSMRIIEVMKKVVDRVIELSFLILQLHFRSAWRKVEMWAGTRERRFTIIFEDNLWLSSESRSGPGSEVESTADLRGQLPPLFKKLGVEVILDAPCGDFNWMRLVDLDGIRYIGIDIVKELIDRNKVMYADPRRRFLHSDLLKDPLPCADLVMCRDCIIHFSYLHIRMLIDAFKKTGAGFLLTSTYRSVSQNRDIRTGNWRPINLEIEPFEFPQPLRLICEPAEQGKYLALFNLEELNTGRIECSPM